MSSRFEGEKRSDQERFGTIEYVDTPISTRAALIQALANESGYGLEIIERVVKATGMRLHQGSVYPALVSLEEDGYIRRSRAREASGRACCYEITRKGSRLAEEQRSLAARVFGLEFVTGLKDEGDEGSRGKAA